MKFDIKKCLKSVKRFIKRNDTKILVTVGVVGTVTGTVMVCKATEKAKEEVAAFQEERENLDMQYGTELDEAAYNKAKFDIYRKHGIKLFSLYAPGVVVAGSSIASIFISHGMMAKRLASVTAAYGTLNTMFKDYRANVVEKYGEEEDFKLLYGIKEEEVEETVETAKGKKKIVKKNALVYPDGEGIQLQSKYARIFDETNPLFRKNYHEGNVNFLKMTESALNDRLNRDGVVFLNDAYTALGFAPTIAGQSVGWVKKNPNGDGYIDLGLHDITKPSSRNFMNGNEKAVIIDFNVDGVILDVPELRYEVI